MRKVVAVRISGLLPFTYDGIDQASDRPGVYVLLHSRPTSLTETVFCHIGKSDRLRTRLREHYGSRWHQDTSFVEYHGIDRHVFFFVETQDARDAVNLEHLMLAWHGADGKGMTDAPEPPDVLASPDSGWDVLLGELRWR